MDAVHLPFPAIPRNFRSQIDDDLDWMGGTYEFISLKFYGGLEDRGGVAEGERGSWGSVLSSVWSEKGGWKILSWSLW